MKKKHKAEKRFTDHHNRELTLITLSMIGIGALYGIMRFK